MEPIHALGGGCHTACAGAMQMRNSSRNGRNQAPVKNTVVQERTVDRIRSHVDTAKARSGGTHAHEGGRGDGGTGGRGDGGVITVSLSTSRTHSATSDARATETTISKHRSVYKSTIVAHAPPSPGPNRTKYREENHKRRKEASNRTTPGSWRQPCRHRCL